MSVLPMRKITLVAEKRAGQSLMATLHEAGVLHISPLPSAERDELRENEITKTATMMDKLDRAIGFLRRWQFSASAIPPKGINAEDLVLKVLTIAEQCEQSEKEIESLKKAIEDWAFFGDFCETLDFLAEAGLSLKLAKLNDEELLSLKSRTTDLHVVKRVGTLNYVAIFVSSNLDLGIRTYDPPSLSLPDLRDELSLKVAWLAKLKNEAARWSYQLRTIENLKERVAENYDRLIELRKAKCHDGLIGISGYILRQKTDDLKRALLKHVVALRIEAPTTDQKVPVMLKNPRGLRGFEAILRTFTGISYFEKDKTTIIALLFMFFGALCLLDAGYGFLLLVTGYVVAIRKDRDLGQVFMWTGAFATVLGIMCGQVFGLAFAKDIMLNIPPLLTLATDPMVCFQFSLLVGLLAMALTNAVAIYQNGFLTHALGCFFLVMSALTMVVEKTGVLAGKFFDHSELLQGVAIGLLVVTAISWVAFPEPVFGKSKRIANILWMTYAGPLALVQDILSHMRLFGIALSGSILALVINKICAQMPVLLGTLFAPLGHGVVFLLALLSLYIHTNRLIFLEFGTKCMRGGNYYFKPFARRT